MSRDGLGDAGERQVHPNVRLLAGFYQTQAAFYADDDDTGTLCGLLAEDAAWTAFCSPW